MPPLVKGLCRVSETEAKNEMGEIRLEHDGVQPRRTEFGISMNKMRELGSKKM